MEREKITDLDKNQLDKVAGGAWDEENNWTYYEGTVVDMGARTAFVKIDRMRETECQYDHKLVIEQHLSIDSRVRVRWPEKVIYKVI